MRKTKLFALLAAVLVMAMLLTACAVSSAKSFDKVLNPDYRLEEELATSAEAISELEGYSKEDENSCFVVFSHHDQENGTKTTKVYSLLAAKVILTVTDSSNDTSVATYEADLIDTLPAFTMIKTTVTLDAEGLEVDEIEEHSVYDAQGTLLTSATFDEDTTPTVKSQVIPLQWMDFVMINFVAYDVDEETGAFTKKMEIPEYAIPLNKDWSIEAHNEYYYVICDEVVTVYDKEFTYLSLWMAPSYASDYQFYVLNDGNLLIQYTVEAEADADSKDFDYYKPVSGAGTSIKVRLHTMIFDVEKGEAKEIEFDYVVESLLSQTECTYDWDADNNYFNDSFDNIVWVCPIVDKRVDDSDLATDMMLMTNNGKLKKSLKLVDGQKAELPEKIGDNLYMVSMINGNTALIDIDGNIQKMVNHDVFECVGTYFKTDRGLYDHEWNKVYSFVENNVLECKTVGNTVFLRVGTEEQYSVLSFRNGTQTTVMTYDANNESNTTWQVTSCGYLLIKYGTYDYYNAAGDKLLSTTVELQLIKTSENSDLYVQGTMSEGDPQPAVYYVFKK